MNNNIEHTKFEGHPEWDTIEVKQKHSSWFVMGHSDGDIQIECSTNEHSDTLFLNQIELKEFIKFLQSKIV